MVCTNSPDVATLLAHLQSVAEMLAAVSEVLASLEGGSCPDSDCN